MQEPDKDLGRYRNRTIIKVLIASKPTFELQATADLSLPTMFESQLGEAVIERGSKVRQQEPPAIRDLEDTPRVRGIRG